VTDEPVATEEEIASVSTLDADEHELAKLLLAESREELTRADAKASLFLAALGIGLSAILGAILAGTWTPFILARPWEAIWWVGATFAGIGVFCLAVAVWPKVRHKSGPSGVTYFGEVAAFETVAELTAALKRTTTEPVARTVLQLHVIARRADHKYAFIRYALIMLGLAVALALIATFGDRFL
jgi:MFS family permease